MTSCAAQHCHQLSPCHSNLGRCTIDIKLASRRGSWHQDMPSHSCLTSRPAVWMLLDDMYDFLLLAPTGDPDSAEEGTDL